MLLLLVLVLLISSMSSLLIKLNSDTNFYIRQNNYSQRSLRLAKQALIGYAVNFPEIDRDTGSDVINGPGYLPCPDINNNGRAGGSCSSSGRTTIGRLPYKTLEVSELTDSTGARLWYVLSDNFRNNPALEPLNSDTAGQLSVDGGTDVVAVLIAPGAPVGGQVRDPAETNMAAEIGNYLEGDNNDLDLDFVSFDSAATEVTDFNDHLVIITRRDLMEPIEKRVLALVENRWKNYQTEMEAFPWLSPFAHPDTSAFKSQIGTYTGHIPFHYSGDADGLNRFTDDIRLSWAISGVNMTSVPDSDPSAAPKLPTPTPSCVVNSPCLNPDDPFVGLLDAPLDIAGAGCTWTNRDTFDCVGSFGISIERAGFAGMEGRLNRLYEFDITFSHNIGAGPRIDKPTDSSPRTRNLTIRNGRLAADAVMISVTDTLTEIDYHADYPGAPLSKQTERTLRGNNVTMATIVAEDILYDLDMDGMDVNDDGDFVDAGVDGNNNGNFYEDGDTRPDVAPDLPAWFTRNEWYKYLHLAYPASEPLPGDIRSGRDCNTLGACLRLTGTAHDDIRAIAVIAGKDLNSARPSADIADYFELENQTPANEIFQKAAITDRFNDRVRIIERVQ